jgi:hypothetical protein
MVITRFLLYNTTGAFLDHWIHSYIILTRCASQSMVSSSVVFNGSIFYGYINADPMHFWSVDSYFMVISGFIFYGYQLIYII